MRFWLKPEERRPVPAPVQTDDRKAFGVGLIAWTVALVLLLVFFAPLQASGGAWWVWTAVAGIALGLLGILYTQLKRRDRG